MWNLSAKQKAEIDKLKKKYNTVTPERVLEFASNPSTALHKRFEWDDSKAAAEYRLYQARNILRVYVVVHEETQITTRAFVSLKSDRGENGYRSVIDVMADSDHRAQLLQTALEELMAFKVKYKRLQELSGIFAELDKLTKPKRLEKISASMA